jgi:hypothetical protein
MKEIWAEYRKGLGQEIIERLPVCKPFAELRSFSGEVRIGKARELLAEPIDTIKERINLALVAILF